MILLLSSRYSFSCTSGHRRRSLRIAIALALSLAVLMVTISVMEYLQDGRFERIRDVQSFDITIEGDFRDEMRLRYPDSSVFLYGESEVLAAGSAYTVRYIDSDYDGGVIFGEGNLDTLAVPYSLYFRCGPVLAVTMLREGRSGMKLPVTENIPVSGAFFTSLGTSFDNSALFMPLSQADEGISIFTAIKGIDDKEAKKLKDEGYSCLSWKEKEAGLYAAFAAERVMMYVVLSLLFVIILVSLKSSVRVFFRERTEEWAELVSLGMSRVKCRAIFLLSFLIIAALGIFMGLLFTHLAIPLGRLFVIYLTGSGTSLEIPYSSFIFFSLIIIAFTLLFVFREEKRMEDNDIAEVLSNDSSGA